MEPLLSIALILMLLSTLTAKTINMATRGEGCASSESPPVEYATDQSLTNMITTQAVADPVFKHLSSTLSIRELVHLKIVNKRFKALLLKNSNFAYLARLDDNSMDCYFQLHFTQHLVDLAPESRKRRRRSSWGWSGVHHPTGEVHILPSLEYLPSNKIKFSSHLHFNCLLASSGSLLLFTVKVLNQNGYPAWNHENDSFAESYPWIPFLVSNPAMQEYQVLPTPANAKSLSWDYHGARAHLLEDECARAYKLLLVFRDRLMVYKSTTKCWITSAFHTPIPWGLRGSNQGPIKVHFSEYSSYYDVPCTTPRGKVLYANLEVDGNNIPMHRNNNDREFLSKGGVRVFEVGDEGGTWKVLARIALKDFIPQDLHGNSIWKFGLQIGSYAIEMVECMGGVYILIPANLDVSMEVEEKMKQLYNLNDETKVTYKDFGFLALRFYILQLNGNGLPFGQAFIRSSPQDMPIFEREEWLRNQLLRSPYSSSSPARLPRYRHRRGPYWTVNQPHWYHCRGLGTVIHILLENYCLQYNVVTGVSTTEVLGNSEFMFQPDVMYMPSLHMKP